MRLFKIIVVFFVIYFIRRFLQLYRAMEKRGQQLRDQEATASRKDGINDAKTVEAEYKVIDR